MRSNIRAKTVNTKGNLKEIIVYPAITLRILFKYSTGNQDTEQYIFLYRIEKKLIMLLNKDTYKNTKFINLHLIKYSRRKVSLKLQPIKGHSFATNAIRRTINGILWKHQPRQP
jgi:hypothetical protein